VTVEQTVWCGGCGRQLEEPPSTPAGERIACPDCGSQVRKFGVEITSAVEVRAGVRAKARSGKAGKPGGRPWMTLLSEPSWSRRYNKWMERLKVEDRRHDRYTEVVRDPDTGEITHECEEPLSEHQGHGSARPRD
jgi:DNA-directed RNA polymerase subunit RPC12/RpoP